MEYKEFIKKKPLITRIQFYGTPPSNIFNLDYLENLAIERLKVLRCIASVSEDFVKATKEFEEKLYSQLIKCCDLGKYFSLAQTDSKSISSEIEKDVVSHFLLLLAHCKSDDFSNWFIKQEMELFKYRFNIEKLNNPKFITKFMEDNEIKAEEVSATERKAIQKLYNYARDLDNAVVYKVNAFEMDLACNLNLILHNGYFYLIEENQILSFITARFRANMSHGLSVMRQSLPHLMSDLRLVRLLSLSNQYLGKDYSKLPKNGVITADQIEGLSKISFPPCMEKIHKVLSNESHLKNDARLQYGLFLKGIGVPLDESLKFWSRAFEKKTDADTFNKKYAYNVRYNYGVEGKRTNRNPFSCVKIITTNQPQAGQCHGCPFQNSNLELMAQNLRDIKKATPAQVEAIVSKARQNQFQISCRNYFKLTHGLPADHNVTINHPNEYFEESQKIMNNALDKF